MKLTRRLSLFFCVVFACAAFAQNAPTVTVPPLDTVVVARGGHTTLTIPLRVNRGFHVNSHQPNDELLVPTIVHLMPPQGIMIVNIQYPEGEQIAVPFMGSQKLSVYSNVFEVQAEVRALHSAGLGTYRVHGEVSYQACDNRQCFPPKNVPVEFDVKVTAHKK